MKLFITGCVVLVFGVLSVDGYLDTFGACPTPDVVNNFNVTRYMGTWYVQLRYRNIMQILLGQCAWSVYSYENETKTPMDFKVENYYLNLNESSRSGKAPYGYGRARHVRNNTQEAVYQLQKPGIQTFNPYASFNNGLTEKEYKVLDTDYEGYSIVWSCGSGSLFSTQRMRVMTRDKKVSTEYLQNMRQKVGYRGLNWHFLRRVGQNKCD